jgi:hypothetical protein
MSWLGGIKETLSGFVRLHFFLQFSGSPLAGMDKVTILYYLHSMGRRAFLEVVLIGKEIAANSGVTSWFQLFEAEVGRAIRSFRNKNTESIFHRVSCG